MSTHVTPPRVVASDAGDKSTAWCLAIKCDHEKDVRRCGHLECSLVEPDESGRCLGCSVRGRNV